MTRFLLFLPLFGVSACSTLADVAIGSVEFAGAKADAYCDRRYVDPGAQAAAFCQEIVGTVAAAEFSDDCRARHQASAGAGTCPRAAIVAGCRILEEHDDDSVVIDWYYDTSALVAERGADAGPEGAPTFESQLRSVAEVETTCADRTRYELGAELVMP